MPSHTDLSPLLRNKNQKNQFRTAQLHIQKETCLFASKGEERTPDHKAEGILHLLSGHLQRISASLSVEAALVLPLFVVAICFLMMPILIMSAQAEAQYHMEQAAELLSGTQCLKQMLSETSQEETETAQNTRQSGQSTGQTDQSTAQAGGSTEKSKLEEYLGNSVEAAASCAYMYDKYPKVLGTLIPCEWKTAVSSDPMIRLRITSVPVFPLSAFLDKDFGQITLVSYRRAWVGREGGAGKSYQPEEEKAAEQTAEQTAEEDDRIVYVARNATKSKRYHITASCHYISNTMTAVSGSSVSSMRTSDGKKYKACSSCKPSLNGVVYLFPASNIYHASKSCRAIQSYAETMKESEAQKKGYSPCSYCGKK